MRACDKLQQRRGGARRRVDASERGKHTASGQARQGGWLWHDAAAAPRARAHASMHACMHAHATQAVARTLFELCFVGTLLNAQDLVIILPHLCCCWLLPPVRVPAVVKAAAAPPRAAGRRPPPLPRTPPPRPGGSVRLPPAPCSCLQLPHWRLVRANQAGAGVCCSLARKLLRPATRSSSPSTATLLQRALTAAGRS